VAYVKNDPAWVNGGAPGIDATRLANMETQYDECSTELGSSGGDIKVHGDNLIDASVASTSLTDTLSCKTVEGAVFTSCVFSTVSATSEGGMSYDPDNDLFSVSFGGSTGELSTRAFAVAMALVL
jgi:hypothetical protein